jgi:hypothetical protein
MEKISRQSQNYRSLRMLYRINMNTTPFPIFIDKHHCYNNEVVSTGTHLNSCYIHESSIPYLAHCPKMKVGLSSFVILLIADGILRRHMSTCRYADNYFTRQYIPEDNSEQHTRRCENLKSHMFICYLPGNEISCN